MFSAPYWRGVWLTRKRKSHVVLVRKQSGRAASWIYRRDPRTPLDGSKLSACKEDNEPHALLAPEGKRGPADERGRMKYKPPWLVQNCRRGQLAGNVAWSICRLETPAR